MVQATTQDGGRQRTARSPLRALVLLRNRRERNPNLFPAAATSAHSSTVSLHGSHPLLPSPKALVFREVSCARLATALGTSLSFPKKDTCCATVPRAACPAVFGRSNARAIQTHSLAGAWRLQCPTRGARAHHTTRLRGAPATVSISDLSFDCEHEGSEQSVVRGCRVFFFSES